MVLSFFFPILIGSFFQQLYNTVDTIIVGQTVGTSALAAVGSTGNSTGNHLHFELRNNGVQANPEKYVYKGQ